MVRDFQKISINNPLKSTSDGLPDVGSAFLVGSRGLLEMTTEVRLSTVIPRGRRYFALNRLIRGEFKPQREKGLFATAQFEQGQYIGTYEGIVIDNNYIPEGPYTYVVWEGSPLLSRGVLGNNGLKSANHQAPGKANMIIDHFDFYASRTIFPDEELTWSYFPSEWDDDSWTTRFKEHVKVNPAARPS